MKITAKKLEDYSSTELRNERFELSSVLIDAWIDVELSHKPRKDRERKCADHKYEIERIIAINELLWETWERNDMYKWFLNDAIWGFD